MELLSSDEINKLFCIYSKKWGVERAILKAVAVVESSMNQMARRHEPVFWEKYKHKFPELADRDPEEVSTSYGLMQIMYTTAYGMGFRGPGIELYNPVINIGYGARLLNRLLNEIVYEPWYRHLPMTIALCRYNGGSYKNPDKDGSLRTFSYSQKVVKAYAEIRAKENGCGETE